MKLFQIIRAHSLLAITVGMVTLMLFLLVGVFAPRVYEANTSILVHKDLDSLMNDNAKMNGRSLVDYVKILKSDMVLGYVSEQLNNAFPGDSHLTQSKLAKRLRIVSAKNTKIIDLKFQSEEPDYAVKMLEFTLKGYDRAIQSILKNSKYRSLSLLENRLMNVQQKKTVIEKEIAGLETEIGTINTDKKNEELLKLNSLYQSRLGEINAGLRSASNEAQHIQSKLKLSDQELRLLSKVQNDQKVRHWQEQLGRQQAELTELSAKFTPRHPERREKEREVSATEALIATHVKNLYGQLHPNHALSLSNLEQAMSERLIEQKIKAIGLQGEKVYYQKLASSLGADFAELAQKKQQIRHLDSKLNNLKKEEDKLISAVHDSAISQAINNQVGRFSVVNPPNKPDVDDYIFPLPFSQLLLSGSVVSIFLSLFSVGVAEYVRPTAIDLVSLPILAELTAKGRGITGASLKSAYQSISMLMSRNNQKSLALVHLCGAKPVKSSLLKKSKACHYSPGVFARQLGVMFMERGLKVLLVDCSGTIVEEEATAVEQVANIGDYQLFQYAGMDEFKVLSPSTGAEAFFDPIMLKQVQQHMNYDLVFVNATLSDDALDNHLIGESVDGVVLAIPGEKGAQELVQEFQALNENRNIRFMGSLVFT